MRASGPGMAAPFVLMDVPTSDHRPLRLCDFATAGARGTRYRSWLSATPALPSPAVTRIPRDGAVIPLGDTLFRWTGPSRTNEDLVEYELRIGNDAAGTQPALVVAGIHSNLLLVASETLRPLAPRHPYYWQVIARNAQGSAESVGSGARFEINPDLAPAAARLPVPSGTLLLSDPLGGRVEASSVRIAPDGVTPASGPADAPATAVETDGIKGMVVYQLQDFPEEDYSASLWLKVNRLEPGRLGQVCSAWSAPMDDPLRLCFEHGKLYARIEAGQGYSTGGAAIEPGQWTHVAFVKTGTRLLLYVNGRVQGEATVPLFVTTAARDIGLGGNPHYPGGEFLPAQFARFELIARALGSDEVRTLASRR
ncbi:MAG: LamG domain-containing protein [Verrucomicrobiota bacterium]